MSADLIVLAIKFGGSITAILLLAAICQRMGLGGDVRLRTEAEARRLAEEAVCGFETAELALDRAGIAALLRDTGGRVMLLRRHGSHFASRLLGSHVHARLDRNFLTVGTGERAFGSVTLDLGDQAQVWAASLRRIGD